MKFRAGFVSNSSSSSFTCDICGFTNSGFDACAEDLGFKMCWNEHVFCESHIDLPLDVDYLIFLKENLEEFRDLFKSFEDSLSKARSDREFNKIQKDLERFKIVNESIENFKDLDIQHLKMFPQKIQSETLEVIKYVVNEYFRGSYESFHPAFCPICSFKRITLTNLKFYIIKTYKIEEMAIFAEIKKENPRRKKLYTSEFIELALKKIGKEQSELEMEIQNRFQNLETLELWLYKSK